METKTVKWESMKDYSDINFEFYNGIAKITINRPEVYNAFRPETVNQMLEAIDHCREEGRIRVIVFTGMVHMVIACTVMYYIFVVYKVLACAVTAHVVTA